MNGQALPRASPGQEVYREPEGVHVDLPFPPSEAVRFHFQPKEGFSRLTAAELCLRASEPGAQRTH